MAGLGSTEAQNALNYDADRRFAPARPLLAQNGAGGARVGGVIRVQIDSEGRPRVREAASENPAVPIEVDTGMVMVAP